MNQIKLSLRAADDSRTIKEEGGAPTFATVFSLHNSAKRGREETIPITVKASHELALTLVRDLKKGTAFVVEGQLSYFKPGHQSRKATPSGRTISPTSPHPNQNLNQTMPREQLERKFLLRKMQDEEQKQGYSAKVKAWLNKPEQADLVKSIKATISPNMKPEKQEQAILTQAKNYIRNQGIKLN